MAILKNAMTLALTFAALAVLSSSAPMQRRMRRQEPAPATLLQNVSAGLDVLYKLSVRELISKLNIPVDSVAAALTIADNLEFSTAMDITCNLYHAKHDLLPSISDSSAVTFVVKKLNLANLKDSCAWLSEVVTNNGGNFTCDVNITKTCNGNSTCDAEELNPNIAKTCKRWSSIKQFGTTSDKVNSLASSSSSSTICRSWVEQVNTASSATLDPDQLCPTSM